MSPGYLRQLELVDDAFDIVLRSFESDRAVLVQSDHGGHDFTHGTERPEDMRIAWMIAGPGIRRGLEIESRVTHLNSAPTLASILGLESDWAWEGSPLAEVFERIGASPRVTAGCRHGRARDAGNYSSRSQSLVVAKA